MQRWRHFFLAVVCFSFVAQGEQATQKPTTKPSTVEYYERGNGPAIVLLHGGNCSGDDWAKIVPELQSHYRLVIPDGLVVPTDPWRIWLLLDHLGIDKVALIGHSAGGNVARQMYRLQPKRVWAFVSVDSEGAGPTILARNLPQSRMSPRAAALYEQNREAMQKLREEHRFDYASTTTIEHRMLAYRRIKMTPAERAATRTWPPPSVFRIPDSAAAPPQPITDTGKFILCPTLVFHTGRGKLGPEDISKQWIEQNVQASDVEYVVIRESGHWPWIEATDEFLSALKPFLSRVEKHAR